MTVSVVIPAGGSGTRIGGRPKQYRLLGGRAILVQSIARFLEWRGDIRIVVAAPADDVDDVSTMMSAEGISARVVVGGSSRQASVYCGLRALDAEDGLVHIHDAVRPFVDAALIERVHQSAREAGAAAPAVPVADTLRRVEEGYFRDTVERAGLFRMQTPQAFRLPEIVHAHEQAAADRFDATDDVALYQRYVGRVACVQGSDANMKITSASDLEVAEKRWSATCA